MGINLKLVPDCVSEEGIPYQLLCIEIPTGIAEPSDLKSLKLPPGIDTTKGAVIEGRAPIWVYGYLVHELHPTSWVATYDTRLGAVIVETHSKQVAVGQVLKINQP